jgi:hypothetical protein
MQHVQQQITVPTAVDEHEAAGGDSLWSVCMCAAVATATQQSRQCIMLLLPRLCTMHHAPCTGLHLLAFANNFDALYVWQSRVLCVLGKCNSPRILWLTTACKHCTLAQLCTAAAAADSSGEFDSANTNSSSGTSTPRKSKPYTPRPVNPMTRQLLQKHLAQLLPRPPHSTPLAPFLSLLLPALQPQLQQVPPAGLLALLRLCNWSGLQISQIWLEAWAAAVQQQLPGMQSETACLMVAEVLRLKQQVPGGLMDTLFIGERQLEERQLKSDFQVAGDG